MKKFCENCGTERKEGADFCLGCGKKFNQETPSQTVIIQSQTNIARRGPYNKWVTFLLCFFLGPLGIHKFYEGKAGMGVLYIFTFGLFGIGILVDLIVALCKPTTYYL